MVDLVADLNDGRGEVFDWYFNSGNVEFHTGGSDPMTFKVSGPSAEHLRGLTSGLWCHALFDHLAGTPVVLGNPTVIRGVGVTHLRYPVRKA